MKSGYTVLGAWIVTCALGYFGPGSLMAERVEGVDPSMRNAG